MDLEIKDKLALVTGSSRGLGQGIVKSLINEGAKVIGLSRTIDKTFINKNYSQLECDLSNSQNLKEVIEHLKDNSLFPEIIINNVGGNLNFTDPLKSSNGWREVSFLNLETSMLLNEAFIPTMIKNKWGRICHVSSIAALENQGPPIYCAAKAALNAYVRSLGRYVCEHNVILTTVMPGAVFTKDGYWDIASKERPEHVNKYLSERMSIKRFGTISEVSELVTVLVSAKSSFCPGSSLLIDGGQGRVF